MKLKPYLVTLPERVVRSLVGMTAGMVREVGEITLPKAWRRSRLYQNLVDTTLRFLIENIGGVQGAYDVETAMADDFIKRRTVGNAIEALGIVAFRASPVWVLAALADLCGMGRQLIPQIADELKKQGLLADDAAFTSMDQLLDGLERTSARMAATFNTPPLDVPSLRQEWHELRQEAASMTDNKLPSRERVTQLWQQLKDQSDQQQRSVFELSSTMALSAVRAVPKNVRRLSVSAHTAAKHTSSLLVGTLLDHYSQTFAEIKQTGYWAYAQRQVQPYWRAALTQFSPQQPTVTQRLLSGWNFKR